MGVRFSHGLLIISMRVLIIATPRSGSTNLTNILGGMLNLTTYHEPYNYGYLSSDPKNYPQDIPNNCIIKTMIGQKPQHETSSHHDFYIEQMKKYDKVLILSRLDVKASYESYNYRVKTNLKGNWHTKYYYEEEERDLDIYCDFLKSTRNLILLAKATNTPVTWYEDIYQKQVEQVVESWNLGLNTSNFFAKVKVTPKYRVNNKKDLYI